MPRALKDFTPADPVTFEQSVFLFNFTPITGTPLLSAGETIYAATLECNVAAISSIVDPTPSARIIGGHSISGAIVSQMFGTFVQGCTYQLVCTITTSASQTFTLWANVYCQAVIS